MIIIGQVSSINKIEGTFEVVDRSGLEGYKNYALYPEDPILVISSKDRHGLVKANYGLIPFLAKEPVSYFESPVEGKARPDGLVKLKKGIIHEPAFRKPIRESRAIVPVDYFILHESEKSILFFNERRPFALAGLVDFWKPAIQEKEIYTGAALLTFPAKGFYKDCGLKRQPLIIDEKDWRYWLKDISLAEVTNMIGYPQDKLMNGYHVDSKLPQLRKNDKSIVQPFGSYLREKGDTQTSYRLALKYRRGAPNPEEEQGQRAWRKPMY